MGLRRALLVVVLCVVPSCARGNETHLHVHAVEAAAAELAAVRPGPCAVLGRREVDPVVANSVRYGPTPSFLTLTCTWKGAVRTLEVQYTSVPDVMDPQFRSSDARRRIAGPGYRGVVRPVSATVGRRRGCTAFIQGQRLGVEVQMGTDGPVQRTCEDVTRLGTEVAGKVFG